MALTKETYEEYAIDKDRHINIRTSTIIVEDGKEIAKTYHRKVLSPGADVKGEAKVIQDISALVWTKEVVDAYNEKLISSMSFLIKEVK